MPYLGKSPSQGVRTRFQFTPNAGTTSISGADANGLTLSFTDGNYVDVYLNGVMLKAGVDYNTNTANTIAGLSATVASDVVDIVVYDTFSVFGGTLEGNVKVNNGTFNVTGAVDFDSTLNVDGVVTTDGATHDGDVTFTGANYNAVWDKSDNALEFGDNAKAKFGTGGDLEIYHTGSTSHIADVGTGSLFIDGTNLQLRNGDGSKVYAFFTDGQDVILNYNNAQKLATTSSGIDVTGGIVADNHVNIGTGYSYQWGDSHERIEQSDSNIEFFTNNSQQMTLSGSSLGIGDSSPTKPLTLGTTTPVMLFDDQSSRTMEIRGPSATHNPSVLTTYASDLTFGTNSAEKMRIDTSGNVGIGTTSPSSQLTIKRDSSGTGITQYPAITIDNGNSSGFSQVRFTDDGTENASILVSNSDQSMRFRAGGATERMRIRSNGNVKIGENLGTNIGDQPLLVERQESSHDTVIKTKHPSTGARFHLDFHNSSGTQGNITVNSGSVSYNSTSDYRKKENVNYDWDGTTRLKQLKPARFNFIDEKDTIDGFLAHEVSEVVPLAVTGEKDQVNKDGEPEYQSMDASKLVPLLVKTIQELEARIAKLEGAE